jgi:hypothetical protein
MTMKFAIALVVLALIAPPLAAIAEDVPDALAVEWQGKKLCENLYEDTQVRVLRCTIPPGAVHVKHSHPASFGYVLSGGQSQVTDSKGTRPGESKTDDYWNGNPIPWHEVANIGTTVQRYLLVEKKYAQ